MKESENVNRHLYNCAPGCPIESTLQVISGKWKSVILYHLIHNPTCRFSELQRKMPNCSRRMLSLQLSELEQDQLVQKKVYPEIPPHTEYQLTEFGKTLTPVITAMEEWGRTYNLANQQED